MVTVEAASGGPFAPSRPRGRETYDAGRSNAGRAAAWMLVASLIAGCGGGGGGSGGGTPPDGATGAEMTVDPPAGWISSGPEGGPFAPDSQVYTVTNTGDEDLVWSAAGLGLTFSTPAGVLGPGEFELVTVGLDPAVVDLLPPGLFVANLSFLNQTNGVGDLNVAVELTVNELGSLSVTPSTGFLAAGLVGGPFTPDSADYTLENAGGVDLTWSATSSHSWLSASLTGGTLSPGQQQVVTIAIDQGAAATFSAGLYPAAITFVNESSTEADTVIVVALDVKEEGTLAVTPALDFTPLGPPGGPFAPPSQGYVLTNTGDTQIAWSASATQSWVSLSKTSGTLAAGAQETVTVSINAGATASFLDGVYNDTVSFTNLTNGLGNDTRNVVLTLQSAPGTLSVDPNGDFDSVGPEGGPFAPASMTYTLSNTGGQTLAWTALSTALWATVSSPGGTLAPGGSTAVVVAVDQGFAATLPTGLYNGLVSFTNTTTGAGSTTRNVSLEVTSTSGGGAPVLPPGPGWSGSTNEPPQVGSGPGDDAKVVARWNVVPHQQIQGDFFIGVPAFHVNGIDRVEMAVEGGPWTPVTQMTFNTRTQTWEYTAILRESDYSQNDEIEVRAIAYPVVGKPRLLDSLFVYVDRDDQLQHVVKWAAPFGSDSSGDGSQGNPYRTIGKAAVEVAAAQGGLADGGFVYLAAGDYDHSAPPSSLNTANLWLTVQPGPGLTKADCRITDGINPGLKTGRVRLYDLTIKDILYSESGKGQKIWADNCHFEGNGQETSVHPVGWFTGFAAEYLTDTIVSDDKLGFENTNICRNVQALRLGSDVFGQTKLVVNCIVDDVDRGSQTSWHPDVYDFGAAGNNFDNYLIYGLTATNCNAQGIFSADEVGSVDNSAFINCLFEIGGHASQWEVPSNHLLLWNTTLAEHSYNWRTPQSTLTNISVRGTVFNKMSIAGGGDSVDDAWFEDNHFIDSASLVKGTDATTGSAGFKDSAGDDYSPSASSPLKDRMSPVVAGDLNNDPRSDPTSVGAYE